MKRYCFFLLAVLIVLTACVPGRKQAPTPTLVSTVVMAQQNPTATSLPTLIPTDTRVPPTDTPAATPTPAYPPEGRGPTGFAPEIDPLTGLAVKDASLLNRRPAVIKVENIPREHRPQWGLTLADLVFEYYTEEGATRFAAVFYGNNSERVGPIRSGRFFDTNVVQMYKGVFLYGSAYYDVQQSFYNSDFYNRLIMETGHSCPVMCRVDPNGQNLLASDTTALNDYLKKLNVDNTRQNLDGMFFKLEPPSDGQEAKQVYLRYSGAVYNRWDYDAASGQYLRFSDKQDDVNRTNEVYEQLTDRLTNKPVAADNVVTLCVPHEYYARTETTEVLKMIMDSSAPAYTGCDGKSYKGGTGAAYIARDGKMYPVMWSRAKKDDVLTLINPDGSLFPFKPGQTWFEVIGASSKVDQQGAGTWRFTHLMVP